MSNSKDNKRVCQGGKIRCMDCRCGKPTVKGERPERWSDYE